MTMTEPKPIRSSSAPEGWQPPSTKEPLTSKHRPVISAAKLEGGGAVPSNVEGDDVSPSQLAKMAGVKPQMIYNYIKQGLITSFINPQGKKRIEKEVAEAWLEKYLTNKQEREEKKRAEIERQLNGIDH